METNNSNKNFKIGQINFGDSEYPELLKCIADPPKTLYCIGNRQLLSKLCFSVVGSRNASVYGKWAARKLSADIVKGGGVVVSGMAAGIDSEAHKGALDAGGETIAVLGCGIDICFPAFNRKLRDEIAEKGLIISEYPQGVHGSRFTFPRRNRIISGLSLGTVIVEAGINSGALITAERAAEQSRQVFAVPGNINNLSSFGTNKLIQDGASLVLNAADIFSMTGIPYRKEKETEALGKDELEILEIIKKEGETTAEFISGKLNKKISQVNAMITVLEIKGMIYSAFGKIFVAN